MFNLPKISNNNIQNDLKVESKGAYTYTKVFNADELKVQELPLKKAAFFSLSTLQYLLTNAFQGKKVVVLNLYDPNSSAKFTKYLAKLEDVAAVSNLTSAEIKDLKKTDKLETSLSALNSRAVDDFAKKILNDEDIKDHSIHEQIEKLKNSDGETLRLLESLGKRINVNTKVDKELFTKLLSETFQETKFKEYNLSRDDFDRLKTLEPYVPFKNIEKLLKTTTDPKEHERIFKTLLKASDILRNGKPEENIYVKKTNEKKSKEIESYSFTITKEGELIIATKYLAAGSFKKVHDAINLSNNESMVKLVVRGKAEVENVIEEEALRENLYNSNNPYIVKPTKIQVLTSTISRSKTSKPKYVFFERRMQGDGESISSKNIQSIAQFCHDYAKGLDIMHNGNPKYVHSDVKPGNALIKDGRAFVADFGLTEVKGEKLKGGTLFFLPPEYLHETTGKGVDFGGFHNNVYPSLDSYSLGMTIFALLDPTCVNNNKYYGFLSGSERKNYMDDLMKKFPEAEFTEAQRKQVENLIDLADKLANYDRYVRPTCGDAASELAALFPAIDTSDPSS